MNFGDTTIDGAHVIDPMATVDERGAFARVWDREVFERRGLTTVIAQCSVSFNPRRGTLRGMHYQAAPYEEVKLVRCTRGVIYDVIIDLRPQSPTFRRWFGVELSAENRRLIYVPAGVAHGFLTLADDTEIYYQISQVHAPDAARGIRWNDPAIGVTWPAEIRVISERDNTYPDFSHADGG
jgi:dTDP-4-dehydrorhamnose 3,5-epimerase